MNERGNALYLDAMANDLGWTLKRARDVASAAQSEGLIRLQKGKRIFFMR